MDDPHKNYSIDQLTIKVVHDEDSDRTYVIYSSLMETQYYSPGVNVTYDKNDNVYIEFIRASIHGKAPKVDLKAEYMNKWLNDNQLPLPIWERLKINATSSDQLFYIPGRIKNIFIKSQLNEKKIWAQAPK